MKTRTTERGSALTEAAIIFPCLVLILYWSAALTDVMVLKLKAAEALRYALWESTVFKAPAQINSEVQQRFVDLRSPRAINLQYTGLLMYPLARDILWRADVDMTHTKVGLGGTARFPSGGSWWQRALAIIAGALSRAVDAEVRREGFNVHGEAIAAVALVHARHDEQASPILKGGDLLGLRGGNDLDHPPSMTNLTFEAPMLHGALRQRPMHLIFDTWKAWPKPAAYTFDRGSTDVTVSPMKTYPVVEEQVSAQVKKIAFFGLTSASWFNRLNNILGEILRSGIMSTLVGGKLPDVLSADRMDGKKRGPITILPVERPRERWAPHDCDMMGRTQPCDSQRIVDVFTSQTGAKLLDNYSTMGDGVDRTRYTVPYRINTVYWRESGGTDDRAVGPRLTSVAARLSTNNDYVKTFNCRGHFFAGSQSAQQADPHRRYPPSCR
jgi:hypothetical protein